MLPIYAKRLKEARLKANNMTQLQVMRATGINNKTLSGYETGKNQPDYDTLKVLCDLYGVTSDWVLGHTNNPNSVLKEAERALVKAIELGDDSFLDAEFTINGRELTRADKEKLQSMARLLLQQDR
ncbi:helix-turn-helix transcriptional regulator [Paenibacillus kribbensis]|uniref:helix-turn-helix domain-containing protein n=1 Tax=Paenibacillus kribbensis TaxID=172713 RepID=UPI002DB88707|nr:helix-turn-helix transcriptional regulator [Paenibacillus kribbensis]MEC0237784.1 helix-turn-helix transcriptional regulator [Paenibacillus kribbensis]